MADRSGRRKPAPVVYWLVFASAVGISSTGFWQVVLWFQQPQWRWVRPPVAASVGATLGGLAVLVGCLVWAFRRERSAS